MEEKPLANSTRNLFLVHAVVALIFGLPLWLIPGRSLTWVGWIPELVPVTPEVSLPGTVLFDPNQARLLGAVLLALAYSSFRGWRSRDWREVGLLVQLEALFCLLGVVALVYDVFVVDFDLPVIVWASLVVLAGFAVAWLLAWRQQATG